MAAEGCDGRTLCIGDERCGAASDPTDGNVNKFNSTRKRMSVVARGPDGVIELLCKGADNVMLSRIRGGEAGKRIRCILCPDHRSCDIGTRHVCRHLRFLLSCLAPLAAVSRVAA